MRQLLKVLFSIFVFLSASVISNAENNDFIPGVNSEEGVTSTRDYYMNVDNTLTGNIVFSNGNRLTNVRVQGTAVLSPNGTVTGFSISDLSFSDAGDGNVYYAPSSYSVNWRTVSCSGSAVTISIGVSIYCKTVYNSSYSWYAGTFTKSFSV